MNKTNKTTSTSKTIFHLCDEKACHSSVEDSLLWIIDYINILKCKNLEAFISYFHIFLEPQTTTLKWMFGKTTISYVKIWNHPIETTIYKWLALGFQVHHVLDVFWEEFVPEWFPGHEAFGPWSRGTLAWTKPWGRWKKLH